MVNNRMPSNKIALRTILIKYFLLTVVNLVVMQSSAIIIRHDKGYGSYLVRESQFPAVFFLERQANRKVCVATLIHFQWAITAAHCTEQTSLSESLAKRSSFEVTVANRERIIDSMVIHPQYSPGNVAEVDLALLHFNSPIDYPPAISLNNTGDELHSAVTLLGWGFFGLGTTGRQYDDGQFRKARNRIEAAGRRLRIRFDDPRNPDSAAMELEGMPGLGDSGGPALLDSAEGWVLAGVAVGELEGEGFSEETQGAYGSIAIYERISRHQDWIQRTIAELSSDSSE